MESPLRVRAAHVALLVLLFALSWTPVRALAGTVTLAWDPVSSPALAGYRLHFGPSTGYYTGMVDVGNTTYVAVSDLPEGVTFHFAVSAYDWSGGSSGYSNDVAKTIPTTTPPGTPPPPTPPPGTTPPGTTEVISVIEYYHAGFDHYFVTGIDDEIKKLDDGTIVGWQRTGYEFNAYAQTSTRGVPGLPLLQHQLRRQEFAFLHAARGRSAIRCSATRTGSSRGRSFAFVCPRRTAPAARE